MPATLMTRLYPTHRGVEREGSLPAARLIFSHDWGRTPCGQGGGAPGGVPPLFPTDRETPARPITAAPRHPDAHHRGSPTSITCHQEAMRISPAPSSARVRP